MSRVIIIGAGIAGMAAAIGLRQLKIETSVIEQATELADMGSGIIEALERAKSDIARRRSPPNDTRLRARSVSGSRMPPS